MRQSPKQPKEGEIKLAETQKVTEFAFETSSSDSELPVKARKLLLCMELFLDLNKIFPKYEPKR